MDKLKPSQEKWHAHIGRVISDVFHAQVEKHAGIKGKDYPLPALLAGCLAILLPLGIYSLIVGVGAGLFTDWAKDQFTGKNTSLAATIASVSKPIQSPKKQISNDAEKCDLDLNGWQKANDGKASIDDDEPSHLILNTKSTGIQYRYNGSPEDISLCEYTFAPRSEKAINYAITLDGVYQITIGDNDYSAIALRAAKKIDGQFLPVNEERTSSSRPRLAHPVQEGTQVKVRLVQLPDSDSVYRVTAEITYTPVGSTTPIATPETFSWVLPSTLVLQVKTPHISVGLIRGKNDDSEIGVNFLSPDPIKAKEAE